MWLLVGLGNPGPRYAQTRHNIGFMVVDELAGRLRVDGWKGKFGAEQATGDLGKDKVLLVKPLEFMNVSGRAVQRTSAFFQVPPQRIVVAHDEIDLPLGALRIKQGGGHGGHNGLRSILADLGSPDFLRVRLGVGRPARGDAADWVLNEFGAKEKVEAEILVKEGADALEDIVKRGAAMAMNKFNVRDRTAAE